MTVSSPHVVVFGSVNMDLVARVSRFVRAGETILGSSFATVPGGKGANQAVAVARLGVPVRMVGRVGQDAFGPVLLDALAAHGVDIHGVATVPGASGVAMIEVDAGGENRITVIPGAMASWGRPTWSGWARRWTARRCSFYSLRFRWPPSWKPPGWRVPVV